MTKTTITTEQVAKVAKLANLTVSAAEEKLFAEQFSTTIDIVNELNEIDTKGIVPTSQVNHLTNVTRPDVIDRDRVLTQQQALSGAKNVYQGFFVVKQIIEKDE